MAEDVPIGGTCEPALIGQKCLYRELQSRNKGGAGGVAVTLDGEAVVGLWGGHADKARTMPWNRDTIVNVFSTTKD